ncbi:MAG: gamma-glutamylcyclotransferase [Chloroflexota bacterium]|nr:gamma-glutamylcyclotransferase [Chloroflexota bacterium]MDE2907608.1 gamma-glutamylcyclotransferase [Chloroflexota bacterium]
MQKLFTYGTLRDPETQQRLLGRTLGDGAPDTLRGYRLAKLTGIHEVYSILQPQAGSTVEGMLYEVSDDELDRLDAYEGEAYQRVSVRLVSKTRAWAYMENPKSSFRIHIEPPDSP